MSYLTHGHRRPRRSVTAGRTIAGLLFVIGPWLATGYVIWRWLI